MKFSKAHQNLADRLDNPRALDHPEEFLGPNWKNILNFWFYLDTLSDEQWEIVQERYYELDAADRSAAKSAAWAAAWDAAWRFAAWDSAGWATLELFGSHKILDQYKSLIFFPMFLNL